MICNKFQEDEKKKEYAFMILNDEIYKKFIKLMKFIKTNI